MKIVLAVDGSAYTKRMLAYLAAHETWLTPANEFTVVHAVPAVPPRAAAVLDKALLREYYVDEAERVFKPIRTFLNRHGISASYTHAAGNAAEVIVQSTTKAEADLLVLGSHGHSSLANLVLGSVVTKVLAKSQVPVLIVR
jgi:nucleotide-binding universal stress UspA family protein